MSKFDKGNRGVAELPKTKVRPRAVLLSGVGRVTCDTCVPDLSLSRVFWFGEERVRVKVR